MQSTIEAKLNVIQDSVAKMNEKVAALEMQLHCVMTEVNSKIQKVVNDFNDRSDCLSSKIDSCFASIAEKEATLNEKIAQLNTKLIESSTTTNSVEHRKQEERKPQYNFKTPADSELKYKVRFSGIPETQSKSTYQARKQNDLNKLNEILTFLGVENDVRDVQRLGKFDQERSAPRKLLVTFSTVWQAIKILNNAKLLKEFSYQVFVAPALSRTDLEIERTILKKRRELINDGVDPKILRIKGLKLYKNTDEISCNPVKIDNTPDNKPPQAPEKSTTNAIDNE